jgi:hypothetical protein
MCYSLWANKDTTCVPKKGGKRKRGKVMPNPRLPSIEERLCRLEAEAFVGVDPVARRHLKRLIDSLESHRNHPRMISYLDNELSALRSAVKSRFIKLERRVRELEQEA